MQPVSLEQLVKAHFHFIFGWSRQRLAPKILMLLNMPPDFLAARPGDTLRSGLLVDKEKKNKGLFLVHDAGR